MNDEHETPRPEPRIGRGLQEAREEKGLTLQQAEQRTKIRARYLRDFERENFDVLPAVYALGSLKTYADFLGLDGTALSRQLKARLGQPAEPDLSAQLAALEGPRDEDGEYEAAPIAAAGFDTLFLGMGVVLISILAVMTLVTVLARGDDSPVSQINEPSTPETPSEIALAANVEDGAGPQPPRANDASNSKDDEGKAKKVGEDGRGSDENKEERIGEEPEGSKNDEDGKEQNAPQAASIFGDADFVPMSPSSPTSAASASTTASASATARPDDSSAPSAPASTGASSPAPSDGGPDPVSAPPATAAGNVGSAPPEPVGGVERAPAYDQDRISAEVDRKIEEVFEGAGLEQ